MVNDSEQQAYQVNVERIMQMIPHRYPFLMIDKVIDIVSNASAVGIRTSPSTSRSSRAISLSIR